MVTPEEFDTRWQLAAAGLLTTILLAISGYFGASAFESLRELSSSQIQMAAIQASQTESLNKLSQTISKLQDEVRENDRRITRREDNQFTAREAAKLSSVATTNATLISKNSERLTHVVEELSRVRDAFRDDVAAMRGAIRRVYDKIGETPEATP